MSEAAKQRGSEAGEREEGRWAVHTFRDLRVWERSMELAERVYLLAGCLPDSERFGLASQLKRASVSVPSNIAEGHGRQSRADYLRHLRIARGSLAELRTQLELCARLHLAEPDSQTLDLVDETGRMLQALIRALIEKGRQP